MVANAVVAPPLQAALVESADATYPILKSLKPETVSPIFNAVVKLFVNKVTPAKFGTFLDRGIDVILSIPDEDLASFTTTVKDAYGDVDPSSSSCDLVPLPVAAIDKFTNSEGLSKVDPARLKALNDKVAATLQAVPRGEIKAADPDVGTTTAALCLPSSDKNLEKIFLAQTDLTLKINREALSEFGAAGAEVGKTIPPAEVFRLLPEFQRTERGVDMKARARFENAGKGLDRAIKLDVQFARLRGKI